MLFPGQSGTIWKTVDFPPGRGASETDSADCGAQRGGERDLSAGEGGLKQRGGTVWNLPDRRQRRGPESLEYGRPGLRVHGSGVHHGDRPGYGSRGCEGGGGEFPEADEDHGDLRGRLERSDLCGHPGGAPLLFPVR